MDLQNVRTTYRQRFSRTFNLYGSINRRAKIVCFWIHIYELFSNMNSNLRKARKPVKLIKVNPSKYEQFEALHYSKRYWKNAFKKLDNENNEPVSNNLYFIFCVILNSL